MSDHWEKQVQEAEADASAAWARMMAAKNACDRRAENKAWREHEKARERARVARSRVSKWEVSASGFAS